MTMVDVQERIYTVEEYFDLEEGSDVKHEYNNGKLTPMPGGTNEHGYILGYIYYNLMVALHQQREKYIVCNSEVKIILPTSNRILYADAFVAEKPVQNFISKKNKNQGVLNPLLVVEVLSESTANYDRGVKFSKYQSISTFKEYILIEQETPMIDVYTKNEKNKWEFNRYEGLEATVEFPTLGITVAMTDIYENITFPTEERTD